MGTHVTADGLKICAACKTALPDDHYYSRGATYCKPCNSRYLKARRFSRRDAAESHTQQHGKTCVDCGELKAANAFKPSNRELDRHAARCRDCQKALAKARIARGSLGKKRCWKKQKYGISQSDFEAMLAAQHYACAICRKPHAPDGPLHVDHDHHTGAVRGLLCLHCNSALGYMRDSPLFCRLAAEYLESSR